MTIITIDGNIGSGKSSILNYIHRNNKIAIDLEPVDNWNQYLFKIYEDNTDYFKFDIRVWLDRAWIQEKTDKITILVERSPSFIKNVFIQYQYDNNLLNDDEYKILNELYNKTDNLWNNNKYIYLRSNPEKCLNRIKKRNRNCEKNISLEYLTDLHNYHELNYEKIKNTNNVSIINVEDKTIQDIVLEILLLL